LNDNPEGTYWRTWITAVACAKTKFRKTESFTVHEFHERCGIDYDTSGKYLPLMTDRDLGDGRKLIRSPVADKNGYVVDPPGEDALGAARAECCSACGCNQPRTVEIQENSAAAIISVVAIILSFGLAVILGSANRPDRG
jgi:hypothetical protein